MALPVGVSHLGGQSLRRRLWSSYALLAVLIVLTGLSGALALGVSLQASDRVIDDVVPAREANAAVLLDLTAMQSGVRGYLVAGDPGFLGAVRRERLAWPLDRRALRSAGSAAGRRALVGTELRLADAWVAGYVDPVLRSAGSAGGLEEIRRTRDAATARAAFDDFGTAAADLDARLRAQADRLRDRSTSVRRTALLVLLLVAAGSAVVGSLAAVTTSRAAVVPLSRLRRTVQAITAGEPDRRADETAGPTEVRAVAQAINALTDERARVRSAADDRAHTRRLAHDVGLRIRERIAVSEVERVALEELGTAFGVDRVLLRRMQDGVLGPVCRQWCEIDVRELHHEQLHRLAELGTAVQAEALWGDVTVLTGAIGVAGELPADPEIAEILRTCEAASCAVVAFGAGREVLGTLTLVQQRQARPWSEAELVGLESVAADLGRALQHALLYDRERALVEQLRELDRTKTDFLSTVSHELRTPLTSITGYIELLRDGSVDLGATASQMLDVIERNSYRLTALIEDLLTLSRIESGAAQTQRVPVDVNSLVRNACADVEPVAVEAGLQLDVVPGPVVQVPGDPGQLDRVLLNLLSNAVKFTPPGGRVGVSWSVDEGGEGEGDPAVLVLVEDTGIGIPEAEAHHLTSRFFRASNAMSAAIPGTGLGLTIVRGILELHGGSLKVSSSSAGTRVWVRLPGPPAVGDHQGTPSGAARL